MGQSPIGSGPYIFAEYRPQEKTILRRNPDYFGEPPYFDEIHLILIEDDKSAEIALEAGDVQFSEISLASVERFEQDQAFQVVTKPSLAFNWIGMCVQNPKLEDINVRQAIRYGIDVNQILAAAYFGRAERECALIAPGLIPNASGVWSGAAGQGARDFFLRLTLNSSSCGSRKNS